MSKSIGFRCPDDVLVEIERNIQLTGLDKTTIKQYGTDIHDIAVYYGRLLYHEFN